MTCSGPATKCLVKIGPFSASFYLYFCLFDTDSIRLVVNKFAHDWIWTQISSIGSNHSTNWPTTHAPIIPLFLYQYFFFQLHNLLLVISSILTGSIHGVEWIKIFGYEPRAFAFVSDHSATLIASDRLFMPHVLEAVWLDWATFKVLGNKFTYKSSPKWLLTFGLFWKRSSNVKSSVDII